MGAQICSNHFSARNITYPSFELSPNGMGVYGMFFIAASETLVKDNHIKGDELCRASDTKQTRVFVLC